MKERFGIPQPVGKTYRVGWIGLERSVSDEFIGNEFCTDQLSNFEEIAVTRYPEEKSDRIAEVAHDELDGEWGIVDVEVVAPPV